MSLKLLDRICDCCDEENDLVLVLPTGFQICERHLIEDAKTKDQSIPIEQRKLICPFFSNNCSKPPDEFTIEQLKEKPINQLRIKIHKVKMDSEKIQNSIQKFSGKKDGLKDKIESEFDNKLETKITKRYQELKTKLNNDIDNLHFAYREYLNLIRRVYRSEMENSFSSLSNIEQDLKQYRPYLTRRDYCDKNATISIKNLDKKLDQLNEFKDKFSEIEKIERKINDLDFQSDKSEIKLQFGDLEYRGGKFICFDPKEYPQTLEKLFKISDVSKGKLPDVSMLEIAKDIEFRGHFGRINMIEQLDNGEIVTASNDQTIKIWSKDGKCKRTLLGHGSAVKCFKVIDYNKLVSASSSTSSETPVVNQSILSMLSYKESQRKTHSSIIVWNISDGSIEKTLHGPKATIYSIVEVDNGNLVTADSDGNLCLWDLNSGNCDQKVSAYDDSPSVFSIIKLKECLVTATAYNPKDSNDKTGRGKPRQIKIWDFKLNECVQHPIYKTSSHHTDDVVSLVKVNETCFLSGSADGAVKFWNFANIDTNNKDFKPIEIYFSGKNLKTIKSVEINEDKNDTKLVRFFCLFDKEFSDIYEVDEKNQIIKNAQNQQPNAQNQQPNAQNQQPNAQNQQPNAQNQQPNAQNQQPNAQNQQPNAQNQQPNAQNQQPNAQNQQPNAQNQQSIIQNFSSDLFKNLKVDKVYGMELTEDKLVFVACKRGDDNVVVAIRENNSKY